MLFLLAKFRALLVAKIQALFYLQKKFWQTFWEQRGKPKIAYYGGVRGLGFFKKEIFLSMLRMPRVYSEENKKVAIMGVKEGSEPIWGKFFFLFGRICKTT